MGLRQGKPLVYHNAVRIVGIRPIAEIAKFVIFVKIVIYFRDLPVSGRT